MILGTRSLLQSCNLIASADSARNPDATNLTLKKLGMHGYDSVSKVADRVGELGEAYEHVIYNPDLAIPRFLVSYRLEVLEEGVENFGESQARESKENFCRIPLMPAASYREDNPGDLHFRMAESQSSECPRTELTRYNNIPFKEHSR